MSSRHQGAAPQSKGVYYTSREVASAIVRQLPLKPLEIVLEPSVGAGAFLMALGERSHNEDLRLGLLAMDIDPNAPALCLTGNFLGGAGDFVDPSTYPVGLADFLTTEGHMRPRWIIGNPPYSVEVPGRDGKTKFEEVASKHVDRALQISTRHVVFLLRLSFLGGKDRFQSRIWKHLRKVTVMIPRPTFTGGGSDSAEYAAFWWDKEWNGCQPEVAHLWCRR